MYIKEIMKFYFKTLEKDGEKIPQFYFKESAGIDWLKKVENIKKVHETASFKKKKKMLNFMEFSAAKMNDCAMKIYTNGKYFLLHTVNLKNMEFSFGEELEKLEYTIDSRNHKYVIYKNNMFININLTKKKELISK